MRRPPLYDHVQGWLARTVNLLQVDGGCFHLASRTGDRIVCQAITNGLWATHLSYGLDLSGCEAVRTVLQTGELLSIDDGRGDGRVAKAARERFGLESIMYCPVRLSGVTEAVAIFSYRHPHRWKEHERQVARTAISEIEKTLATARMVPRSVSSTHEAMLNAVTGLVNLVDRDLLTQASTGTVLQAHDLWGQLAAVSVDELLRNSDRGHELRTALLDIVHGDLDRFEGLFKTAHGSWWVIARAAAPGSSAFEGMVVVHVQPLPAVRGDVAIQEERARLEALGRIVGTVAHEVNNALQSIAMGLDELEGGTHARERSAIMAATQRAARVTSQLLTFARRAPSQFVRTDLTEFVAKELDLARRSVGSGQFVSLRLRGRAEVQLDVRKMELVLVNLCRNAADASPIGSEIVIEAGVERREGRAFGFIAVVDSGSGMPEDVARSIGDFLVSSKPAGLGSGIGLAVVKQVAKDHGGEVEVSRGDGGVGTRVAVNIPLDAQVPSEGSKPMASGPRVLVVDDEVEVTRLIGRALDLHGYQTRLCTSLAAAKAAFDADPRWADLVIFDLNLNDGSGLELYRYARSKRPNLKCIAMSGFVDRDDALVLSREDCKLLSKPFLSEELHSLAKQVLDEAEHEVSVSPRVNEGEDVP